VSLVLVALITAGSWGLLRDSFNLALDGVPPGIQTEEVTAYLSSLPGVSDVHDVHIWGLSTTHAALTAHLVVPDGGNTDSLIATATRHLHDKFGIEHATVQIEQRHLSHECALGGVA